MKGHLINLVSEILTDRGLVAQITTLLSQLPDDDKSYFTDQTAQNYRDRLRKVLDDKSLTMGLAYFLVEETEWSYLTINELFDIARYEFVVRAAMELSQAVDTGKDYELKHLAEWVDIHSLRAGLQTNPLAVRTALYGNFITFQEYGIKYGVTIRHLKTNIHFQRVLRVIPIKDDYLVEDRPLSDAERALLDEQTYLTRPDLMAYLNCDYWVIRALDIQPDNDDFDKPDTDKFYRSPGNLYHFPKIAALKNELNQRPIFNYNDHHIINLSLNNEPSKWCLNCGCRYSKKIIGVCNLTKKSE